MVGPSHFYLPTLTHTALSLHPIPPPMSHLTQATSISCPHRFCRSHIFLPQNRHRPGRHPDRHPYPHHRLRRLSPRPRWVSLYPLRTPLSPYRRLRCCPCPTLLPTPTLPYRITPLPTLSIPWAVISWPPAVAWPPSVDWPPNVWSPSS